VAGPIRALSGQLLSMPSRADLPTFLPVMALRAESDGVFEAAGVAVLYCGVGKVNAAIALTRELDRYEHARQPLPVVLNFGTAGSRDHATGTFLACHEFVQRDMDVRGLGFALGETPFDEAPRTLKFDPIFFQLAPAICGSGDSFVTGTCEVACNVMDMEAYALAKVCWLKRAPFGCVKYVTDGADHAAAADWQSNVHKAATRFLHLYDGVRGTVDRATLSL
jgi:adenosylhomocysteine nucleosidase